MVGCKSNLYALYDDNYVYLAATIKDDGVISAADSYMLNYFNPYANGFVRGVGNNMLVPRSGATRSQAASIFMRFTENVK